MFELTKVKECNERVINCNQSGSAIHHVELRGVNLIVFLIFTIVARARDDRDYNTEQENKY